MTEENPLAKFELNPGDVVGGRYEIVRLLGAGGMGAVFEAKHQVIGRIVAIKVLHPQIALHPQYAGRFLQEARAAAELSHKNIVQLTDYGLDGERPYMVMEYLHGESLGAAIEREGRMAPGRVAAIIDPVLKALAFAHERGVIHRDIKPDNIFLARDEEGEVTPKIVDFGIAKRQDESVQLTSAGAALGTPAYMAPEQIMSSKSVTPAADQYAVGITMYEALVGENPYTADTLNAFIVAKATQEARPIREHRPDLDAGFAAIVMRALAKNPEDRFPSVTAMREALVPWRGGAVTAANGGGSSAGQPTARQLSAADALARTAAPSPPMAQATRSQGSLEGASVPVGNPVPETVTPTPAVLAAASPRPGRGAMVAAVVVVGALLAVGGSLALSSRGGSTANPPAVPPPPTPPAPRVPRVMFTVQVSPDSATILLDGVVLGTGRVEVARPKDGERHQLEIRAEGYVPISEVLEADGDVRVSRTLQRLPTDADAALRVRGDRTNAAREGSRSANPSPTSAPTPTAPTPTAPTPTTPTPTTPVPPATPTPTTAPAQPAAPSPPTAPQGNHPNIDTANPF